MTRPEPGEGTIVLSPSHPKALVQGFGRPGEPVTLCLHNSVTLSLSLLKRLYRCTRSASSVLVIGGQQAQRENVCVFLKARDLDVSMKWHTGYAERAGVLGFRSSDST